MVSKAIMYVIGVPNGLLIVLDLVGVLGVECGRRLYVGCFVVGLGVYD